MELQRALRARRMVRSFTDEPVASGVVERLVEAAERAPAAGNTSGRVFVVLEGERTERLWRHTLPAERRPGFGFPGLLRAPVLIVPFTSPQPYVQRYQEPDKAGSGLDAEEAWPVAYWTVDTAMAVQNLLLAAVDEGLGACLFGLFEGEDAVCDELGAPPDWRPIGAVALGHPDGGDRPGRSASRPRRPLTEVLLRDGWRG